MHRLHAGLGSGVKGHGREGELQGPSLVIWDCETALTPSPAYPDHSALP